MHESIEYEPEPSPWYSNLLLAVVLVGAAATFVVAVLPQPSANGCEAALGCPAAGADGAMEVAITRMRELPATRSPRILRGATASSGAKGSRDP